MPKHSILTNRTKHRLFFRLRMTASTTDVIPIDRYIKTRTFRAADAPAQKIKFSSFQLARAVRTWNNKCLDGTSNLFYIQTPIPIFLVSNFMDFTLNIIAHRSSEE